MSGIHEAEALIGGKVIATGRNGFKSRRFSRSICTTHAEINCLQNIKCKERKRSSITIRSYFYSDHMKNSKPCRNCCMSMIDFGITKTDYFDGCNWVSSTPEEILRTAIISSGDRYCYW
tara:strand:+ start:8299 stop:8655 length:357 start_codon:yes stop_codon:yes gene_type:complete